MARISTFTQEKADEICDRLARGELLTKICADDGMPSRETIWRWQVAHPDFKTAYHAARVEQILLWSDEIMAIADDDSQDNVTDETGRTVMNKSNLRRAYIRIDTRKWFVMRMASVLYPKLDDGVPVRAHTRSPPA